MAENCGRTNRYGEPCGLSAGWGTDHNGEGACKFHGGNSGGKREGAGAPEGNQNRQEHGGYASPVNYFKNLRPEEKDRVKQLQDSYIEDVAPFGPDDPRVERLEITCIKILQEWRVENQMLAETLSEETVVGVNDSNEPIMKTEGHHLRRPAHELSGEVLNNLKALNCLPDAESRKADAQQSIAQLLSDSDPGSGSETSN